MTTEVTTSTPTDISCLKNRYFAVRHGQVITILCHNNVLYECYTERVERAGNNRFKSRRWFTLVRVNWFRERTSTEGITLTLTYRTEEKLGGKKLWRIPQSEFWQTKSLANYATRYRADVITLKVCEKTLANFYRFAKVFYRQVFLPYGINQKSAY